MSKMKGRLHLAIYLQRSRCAHWGLFKFGCLFRASEALKVPTLSFRNERRAAAHRSCLASDRNAGFLSHRERGGSKLPHGVGNHCERLDAQRRINLGQLFYLMTLAATAISLFHWWGILVTVLVGLVWRQLLDGTLRELQQSPNESCVTECRENLHDAAPTPPSGLARKAITRGELVVVLLLVGLMVGLMLPAQPDSDPMRQGAASLRLVAKALEEYRDDCGEYPPTVVRDAEGRPLHSWRALLLPYLDEPLLAAAYHFDEPWDGQHNSLLRHYQPWHYRDFSCVGTTDRDTTCVQMMEVDGRRVLVELEAWRCDWLQPTEVPPEALSDYASLPACGDGFWDDGFFSSTFRGRLLATENCELIVHPDAADQVEKVLQEHEQLPTDSSSAEPVMVGQARTVVHYQQAFRFIAFVVVVLYPLTMLDRFRKM